VFDGDTSKVVSNEVETLLEGRNKGQDHRAVMAFSDDKLVFSFCTNGQWPDTCAIYDFKTDAYSSSDEGYTSLAADRKNRLLSGGTATGITRWRNGSNYRNWKIKTKDLTTQIDSPSAWGKYQIDMVGDCTVNVYLDDSNTVSETISRTTRGRETFRFPTDLAQRIAIELVGSGGSSQDIVYSIGYSAEVQRGLV